MDARTPTIGRLKSPRLERGFTLIELMVSLAIGLLLVIVMTVIFVNSSNSRRELTLSAEVIENGRYALSVLERELSQSGFYGTLVTTTGDTLNDSNICTKDANDLTEWANSLAAHVKGFNNDEVSPACLGRKAGTDAIFIQRASTCQVGEIGCDAESSTQAYLQVSECGSEYNTKPFVLEAGNGGTDKFVLQTNACESTKKAGRRRLIRRFYYISEDSALSYRDVTLDGPTTPVALVEDIDQMQIEYAIDSNADGTVDIYSSTPANSDWVNVIGVRIWVLARSSSSSRNVADAVTFTMGDSKVDIAAATTNLKRRVYNTYISFASPKARREF